MIPKTIHYCWISGDEFPEKNRMCIDSWKRYLPDYEIVLWDYEKVHALDVRWCEEAIAARKYAFVADYIRFYALYNFGGIYLDSDVEVLKPFDNLLNLKYFVGKEQSIFGWEAAVLGAEKGVFWVKTCLDYYKSRRFVNAFGETQIRALPSIMDERLNEEYTVKDCLAIDDWEWDKGIVCRFPADWFSPKVLETREIQLTDNSYSIHHFSGSWCNWGDIVVPLSRSQKLLKKLSYYAYCFRHDILHIEKPIFRRHCR
ncbi:MAG: glycosyltransferase family 32 protein [Candidatus Cryptobacteroides sp.]